MAWGGPVVQIARLKQELVEQERWVTPQRFNRALGVYQALPGPEATELCVWFGTLAGGRLGGLAAGLGFVLPGLALMLAASWAYTSIGWEAAWVAGAMAGLKPAVAALILRAVHRLSVHALRNGWLWAIAVAAAAASAAGVHFGIALSVGGAAHGMVAAGRRWAAGVAIGALLGAAFVAWQPGLFGLDSPSVATATRDVPETAIRRAVPTPGALFGTGLKAGMLTFGGAYTAIPFVRDDAVERGGWISESEFLDGIAIGSVLPAPLVVFATFVGYLGGGWLGAGLMTLGVFLPAFGFTLIGHRLFEAVVERPSVHALLDGVTAAVIGLISLTAVEVTVGAVRAPPEGVLLMVSLVVLYLWRSAWSVPALMGLAAVSGGLLLGR